MAAALIVSRWFIRPGTLAGTLLAVSVTVNAADPTGANVSSGDVLLTDSLGRTVAVSTNDLSRDLQPSTDIGLDHQISLTKGASLSDAVSERLQQQRGGRVGIQFFPAVPPLLMPYLASQDEFGNTAVRPGPLLRFAPFEPPVQNAKYRLSEHGLRYSLENTLTYVNLTDVAKGDHTLGFYTFDFQAKWAVFDAPAAGTAGWISTQVEAKRGVDSAGRSQSAKSNLGTITDPTGLWSKLNGVRVPELAWQQSACDGKVVAIAGVVSQGNYIDQNAYAQSGRSHFINSALITSMVLPEPSSVPGLNLQWQPAEEFYVMGGASAGNAPAGHVPWNDFSWSNWSAISEFGFAPRDVLGLGPGIYRVQPFVAETGGSTGAGLCFNLQQKLGLNSPYGWFGRFGFGDVDVSAGAAAQIGTGFVMQGPLKHLLLERTSNDLLGVGFVWSQPAATTSTVYHENEYTLETIYVLQLTPMIKLQPDVQMVWNPAQNPNADRAVVFQLQIAIAW